MGRLRLTTCRTITITTSLQYVNGQIKRETLEDFAGMFATPVLNVPAISGSAPLAKTPEILFSGVISYSRA